MKERERERKKSRYVHKVLAVREYATHLHGVKDVTAAKQHHAAAATFIRRACGGRHTLPLRFTTKNEQGTNFFFHFSTKPAAAARRQTYKQPILSSFLSFSGPTHHHRRRRRPIQLTGLHNNLHQSSGQALGRPKVASSMKFKLCKDGAAVRAFEYHRLRLSPTHGPGGVM